MKKNLDEIRCWSYIGRRGGRQDLSLRPPDYPLKRSDEEEEEDKKETSSPHHWWRRKKKKKKKKKVQKKS